MRKNTVIYALWGLLYCICVGLGFVENAEGLGKVLLVLTSLIFFLPPYYLVFQAQKKQSRKTVLALRLISAGILLLSLVLLVLNFLSVYFSSYTGMFLHVLLVIFTAPMMCGQYWVLSLFLWAVLLMLTLQKSTGSSPDQR